MKGKQIMTKKRSRAPKAKGLPLTGNQRRTLKTWLANGGIIRQTARKLDRDRNLVKVELKAALKKLGHPTDFDAARRRLIGKRR